MFFRNKPLVEKKPNKKKNDDYKDFIDDDHLNGDGYEPDPTQIIEIICKDNQLSIKQMMESLKVVLEVLPSIAELKAEVNSLKAELREEKMYNRELINKLIDKPLAVAPAALSRAPASLADGKTGTGGTLAGPRGKLP